MMTINRTFLLLVSAAVCCTLTWQRANAAKSDSLVFGVFGKVMIYQPETEAKTLVLFASGDGGWNLGVIDMAKQFAKEGAIVAGFNIRHYFNTIKKQDVKCYYPASDLEELSMIIQKKYKFKQYMKPVLVGYSSGATLVYGALAQAPANTFKGAISLGFCPDIELNKTLCDGSGLQSHVLKENRSYYLEECKKLTAPFIVLQGVIDSVCDHKTCAAFVQNCGQYAELVSLPKVGHGFSVPKNWIPQFSAALNKIVSEPSFTERMNGRIIENLPDVSLPPDLPLTTIKANKKDSLPFLFFISGDGGWTGFDQALSQTLAARGVSVVGLDAQKYFWNEKTPAQAASDISLAIEHFMQQWKTDRFMIAGYSFGADVLPFIIRNFSDNISKKLNRAVMISPSEKADFEIHVSDMLNFGNSNDTYDVLNEVRKISALRPVCVFGDQEDESSRNNFVKTGAEIVLLPGSHHYNNDYERLANVIFRK